MGLKQSYRPDIDGLRALAVLAVIANHFDHKLVPSGHLGVDIFFVISGFVITASLYRRPSGSFSNFLVAFYSRRLKRLVPALILCVLVSSVLISLVNKFAGVSVKTGIAALVGASNLYLFRQATDYFGASAQLNVFTHTWSLGVEEQFYFLYPFVFWFTGMGQGRDGALRRFSLVIGGAAALSLAIYLILHARNSVAAFFLMPARFWELSAGVLVFAALASGSRIASAARKLNPSPVLALLLVAIFLPPRYAVASTVAVTLLTVVLLATLRPSTTAHDLLVHPWSVYFGRTSYSLYLWHWPIVALSRWTIGLHPWTIPFQLVLVFGLAHLSYNFVERPLRTADWSPLPSRSVVYGVTSLAVTAALLLVLAMPLRGQLFMGNPPRLLAAGVETLTSPYVLDAHSGWKGEPCVLSSNSEVGKAVRMDDCTLGNPASARRRILVLGNSFSASFVPAFDELVREDEHAVTIVSSWGASPVEGISNSGNWNLANDYYWATVVPYLTKYLRPGDAVFLVNDLAGYSPDRATAETEQGLAELRDRLMRFSEKLRVRGIELAVLHGIPFAREAACEPFAAAPQWFAPFGPPCRYISRQKTLERRARLDSLLSQLALQQKLVVVDLMDVFCPGPTCTYYSADGQMLYRDGSSHPSVEAARLSASKIRTVLRHENRTWARRAVGPGAGSRNVVVQR